MNHKNKSSARFVLTALFLLCLILFILGTHKAFPQTMTNRYATNTSPIPISGTMLTTNPPGTNSFGWYGYGGGDSFVTPNQLTNDVASMLSSGSPVTNISAQTLTLLPGGTTLTSPGSGVMKLTGGLQLGNTTMVGGRSGSVNYIEVNSNLVADGSLTAEDFIGSGAGLTGIPPSAIVGGVLPPIDVTQLSTNGGMLSITNGAGMTNIEHYGTLDLNDNPAGGDALITMPHGSFFFLPDGQLVISSLSLSNLVQKYQTNGSGVGSLSNTNGFGTNENFHGTTEFTNAANGNNVQITQGGIKGTNWITGGSYIMTNGTLILIPTGSSNAIVFRPVDATPQIYTPPGSLVQQTYFSFGTTNMAGADPFVLQGAGYDYGQGIPDYIVNEGFGQSSGGAPNVPGHMMNFDQWEPYYVAGLPQVERWMGCSGTNGVQLRPFFYTCDQTGFVTLMLDANDLIFYTDSTRSTIGFEQRNGVVSFTGNQIFNFFTTNFVNINNPATNYPAGLQITGSAGSSNNAVQIGVEPYNPTNRIINGANAGDLSVNVVNGTNINIDLNGAFIGQLTYNGGTGLWNLKNSSLRVQGGITNVSGGIVNNAGGFTNLNGGGGYFSINSTTNYIDGILTLGLGGTSTTNVILINNVDTSAPKPVIIINGGSSAHNIGIGNGNVASGATILEIGPVSGSGMTGNSPKPWASASSTDYVLINESEVVTNNLTVGGATYLSSNTISPPTVTASGAYWNSNNWLYWVTPNHPNGVLISAP